MKLVFGGVEWRHCPDGERAWQVTDLRGPSLAVVWQVL